MSQLEKDEAEEDDNGKTVFFGYKDIGSDYYQVLLEKKRPKLCKALWYLVTCICLACTVFMVYKLLTSYFKYSSYNQVTAKWTDRVTLPAFSICSTNILNYTLLKSTLKMEDLELLEKLLKTVEISDSNSMSDLDLTIYGSLQNIENEDEGGVYDLYRYFEMNPEKFNMIDTFELAYDYKFAKNFKMLTEKQYDAFTRPTELGWCLELNDDASLVQTVGGMNGGFTIELNANIADYLLSTSSVGFMVFIRNAGETVMIADSGYHLEPGKEVFLKLQKNVVTRLKGRYGKCSNSKSDWNTTVLKTARECNDEMRMTLMSKYCGCLPWYLLDRIDMIDETVAGNNITMKALKAQWTAKINSSVDTNAADFTFDSVGCSFADQQICDAIVQKKMLSHNTTDFCEESCAYNDYSVTVTTSKFPSTEEYYKKFIEPYTNNKDFSYARANFIKLHIFYGELKETTVAQVKAYEIQNFIAEFGGTVDLLIGISFFTVFQLFEISIAMILLNCCRRPREK